MFYFWSALVVALNTVWLGLVLFGLPGNWLIVITTCVFAWWRWEERMFSTYTLIALVLLAILGELVEFLGGMTGARKAGAGWLGSIGAIAGAMAGGLVGTFTIPIPLLGTVLGACVGAGLCAWGLELVRGRKVEDSFRSGVGAGVGEFFGITCKFAVGIVIWLTAAVAAFWP
jgi:uncharacterized protein YqgC (DUF456 family)